MYEAKLNYCWVLGISNTAGTTWESMIVANIYIYVMLSNNNV